MYNTWIEQPYNEAVMSILGDLDVPIIFDADIGHKGPQFLNDKRGNCESQQCQWKRSYTICLS